MQNDLTQDWMLSYSRIGKALLCPLLYDFTYIQEKKMETEHVSKYIGKLVHEVIEEFYRQPDDFLYGRYKNEQVRFLGEARDDAFRRVFSGEALETVLRYFREYRDAVEDVQAFQLTTYGTVCKAPEWTAFWKRKYAAHFNEIESTVLEPLKQSFPWCRFAHNSFLSVHYQVVRCVDNFLKLHRRVMRNEKPMKIHSELAVIGNKVHGRHSRGAIDIALEFYDGRVEVYDFKTGKKQWEPSDVVNSNQLLGYTHKAQSYFNKLPSRMGIWDLWNDQLTSVPVTVEMVDEYLSRMQGITSYASKLHETLRDEGLDKALETFPLPIGTGVGFCPCDLAYQGPEMRCPRVLEVLESTKLDDKEEV